MSGAEEFEYRSHDESYTDKTMMVDGRFADGAYIIKKSVGRIVCDKITATGFVISKGLIMTCQHVGSEVSDGDVIQFQYLEPLSSQNVPGGDLCPEVPEMYYLQPSTFYYGSDHYDFAVIAIAKSNRNLKNPVISCVNAIHARNRNLLADLRLNIFSHPEGKPLVLSFLQKAVENPATKLVLGNKRRPVTEEFMLHSVNTEMGSSGAPIFDAKWHLVALHQGVAVKEVQSQGRLNDVFYCNYGTLMKYILDEMYSKQDAPLTMFEKKLQGCADELGVPFPEFSTKLKDRHPAGPVVYSGVPERSRPRRLVSLDESAYHVPSETRGYAVQATTGGRPTFEELDDLSRQITGFWASLGRKLGVREEELDCILANNTQFVSPPSKAYQMLKAWKNQGKSATCEQLAGSLRALSKGRLAEQFE